MAKNKTIDLAVSLSMLESTIYGGTAKDNSGWSVSSAGDINKDGYADIIIGAPLVKAYDGESYVIYGGTTISDIDLSVSLGVRGFTIHGDFIYNSGFSVSSAGDVNKDGYADFIIGAPGAAPRVRPEAGASYVIYGSRNNPGTIGLSNLGTLGFAIYGGSAGDQSGSSVSSAGDVNKDGYADIIIGARAAAPNGQLQAGASYVVYGSSNNPYTIDLLNLGTQGFAILGATVYGRSGWSVSAAGDVNGDGYADVIVGSIGHVSHVVYGGSTNPGTIDLSVSLGTKGFNILVSGSSVSAAGDVNGDGYDDIIIGDFMTTHRAYVIYGSSINPGTINPGVDLGTKGFIIFYKNQIAADSVSSAGDINRDGYADVIIVGQNACVIYGSSANPGTIDLSVDLGNLGFVIKGIYTSASGAGDVNKDGYADIIMGNYTASPYGRTEAGESYIIYGAATPTPAPVPTLSPTSAPTPSPTLPPIIPVTPYEYAIMSLNVYQDKDAVALPSSWNPYIYWNSKEVPQEVITNTIGYRSVAYINHNKSQVVVAHRGTASVDDYFSNGYLLCQLFPDKFPLAQAFVQYVINVTKSNHSYYEVSNTGHSLGAALSELTSAIVKIPSITFDSPGVATIMSRYPDKFTSIEIEYINNNAVSYLSTPNAVNTMAVHVGKLYRVFIEGNNYLYLIGLQPNEIFYSFVYSFKYMHSMVRILAQFNNETQMLKVGSDIDMNNWPVLSTSMCSRPSIYTFLNASIRLLVGCKGAECGGYNQYNSYGYNTYYWNNYVATQMLLSVITGFALVGGFITYLRLNLETTGTGLTIIGDDSGNKIFGTSNFDDKVTTGTGNDIQYLFGGNDISTDEGGYDIYYYPQYHISDGALTDMGQKIIRDSDGVGEIHVGSNRITGAAYPISFSKCSYISTSDYLLVIADNAYVLHSQASSLIVFSKCGVISNLRSSIQVDNFNWGNFGINRLTSSDTEVLVAGSAGDVLNCTQYSKCIAYSPNGGSMFIASVNQEATLISGVSGNDKFKFVSGINKGSLGNNLNVYGIKDADMVDISELNLDNLNFTQNGTDGVIKFADGNVIHLKTSPDYYPVQFNLTADGTITTEAINISFNFNRSDINYTDLNLTEIIDDYFASIRVPLVIAADNVTIKHGASIPATFTANYKGFVGFDSPRDLTTEPKLYTTANSTSGPGKYPIIPEGAASPDYNITYVDAVLTIEPTRASGLTTLEILGIVAGSLAVVGVIGYGIHKCHSGDAGFDGFAALN